MLAFQKAGIPVDRYVAYEIDKYAIQTSVHNFPEIEQKGDVFSADFSQYEGVDFVIGGSPCTYWSIAQKNGRETEASGMGWELFQQYVRAIHDAKPRFFVYENNKSMSKAIRASIDEAFGFEAVDINSALVSAQNRQRLYWVGKRNEDGTYSKVDIEQPEDLGIVLKDILECGTTFYETQNKKAFALVSSYYKAGEHPFGSFGNEQRRQRVVEPVYVGEVPEHKGVYRNGKQPSQQYRVYSIEGKSVACDRDSRKYVATPVCVAERGRYAEDGSIEQRYEAREDGKSNVLTTVQKDNNVAEPVRVGALPRPNGELSTSQAFRVYSTKGKSVNLTAGGGGAGGKTGLYAIPVEFDGDAPVKATSAADGKTYTVYEVNGGQITIKGKSYPIKLEDGFYIIRKLTVKECMRLQTVPEWYEFPVSNSQAYKMLGNGWTVDVIAHLLRGIEV